MLAEQSGYTDSRTAIDDDDDIQALLRVALKTGFVVTSAMDGEEALDWLNRGTFDVILLDMNLPDMTGYDVLSSARRRRIETPCLLLTAENSSAAIAPVLKLGVASYVPKPINPRAGNRSKNIGATSG